MKRKAIALIFLASFGVSLTGCSFGKKLNEKNFVKFIENDLEIEEVDIKKAGKLIEKADEKEISMYFRADAQKTKKFLWKEVELEDYYAKPANCESSISFFDGSVQDNMVVVTLVTFESEDDATEFIENTEEMFDELVDDGYFDDYYVDKEYTTVVSCATEDYADYYMCAGAYREGKTVLLMTAMNYDGEYDFDILDDLCEKFELDSIEDLLD